MKKNMLSCLSVGLIFILFFLGACGSKGDPTPEKQGKETTESSAKKVDVETKPITIKGTNEKMQYSLDLPQGWQVTDFSKDHPNAKFFKASSENEIKMDSPFVSVSIGSENLTPKEVLGMFVKEGDGIKVEETTLGGLPAWRFVKEALGHEFLYIVAEEKGRSIQVNVGPPDLANDEDVKVMLDSLRFDIKA